MMYSIEWMARAEDDLAALWLDPAIRSGLWDTTDRLEVRLAERPEEVGLHLFATVYSLEVDELGVEYEVFPNEWEVRVLRAWNAFTGRPDPTDN